jgi:hypothetical protein
MSGPGSLAAFPQSSFNAPTYPQAASSSPPVTDYQMGEAPAASNNPYAMSSGMAVDAPQELPQGELVIQRAAIDRIVSLAVEIFGVRWQPLVLAGVITFGASFVLQLLASGATMVAAINDPIALVIVGMIAQFLIVFVSYYFNLGLMRISLEVSRGQLSSPTHLFVAPGLLAKVFAPVFLLTCTSASTQLGILFLEQGNDDFSGVLMMLGLGGIVGLINIAILFFIWPMFYLAVDNRGSNFGAMKLATRIVSANLVNTFLLGLISVVLGIAGALTCGIGVVVTQPLMMLVGCVAYLMMTGQPIYDPKGTAPIAPSYTYTPTKF